MPSHKSDFHKYEQLANDLVVAHNQRDQTALDRLNQHYRRSFTLADLHAQIWRRIYAFRQRSKTSNNLLLAEAQTLLAQDVGFSSWSSLREGLEAGGKGPLPAV